MSDILQRITVVLNEVFDDESLVATEDLTAQDVPGWDSLAHIRFIISIEREFSIKFSASEISNIQSIGDLARVISAKTR